MACRTKTPFALPASTLLITSALLLSACDRDNDDDDGGGLLDDNPGTVVSVPPQTDVRGIDVFLRDQTGQRLNDVTLLVLNDEQNGDLIDDALETSIVEAGATRVSVKDASEEAIVRLEAEKDGYFSNGARYVLQPGEDLSVDIVLTAIDTDEPGIRVAGLDGNLSEGSLTVNATAQDNPEETLTSVTVPQDLEILDADGNVLDEDLRISVVHFDSRDEQALTSFPGGFSVSVENVMDIDTQAIEGTIPSESTEELEPEVTFQSVGFTAVEIFDSQGRKADEFNGSISVTMAIPANAENPNTGRPIAEGDVIPVWSFDTDTADWRYEGRESVQRAPNGGLQVVYEANHLSYWNLDFFTRSTCDANINVDVFGSDGTVVNDVPLVVTILGAGENNIGFREQKTLTSGNISLFNISAELLLGVRFRSVLPTVTIEQITLNGSPYNGQALSFCGDGDGNRNFSVVTNTPADELEESLEFSYDVSVNTQCLNAPETAAQPVPNTYVFFMSDDGETYLTGRTNQQGNVTLTGKGNPSGEVYASYNGRGFFQPVSSDGDSVNFEFDTNCVITTGAGGQ